MKIKELIKLLEQFDEDLRVMIDDNEDNCEEVNFLNIIEVVDLEKSICQTGRYIRVSDYKAILSSKLSLLKKLQEYATDLAPVPFKALLLKYYEPL